MFSGYPALNSVHGPRGRARVLTAVAPIACVKRPKKRYTKFKVDKMQITFDIEKVHKMWKAGELNLEPHYQRGFLWNQDKSSRLVETILMNSVVPQIIVHERLVEEGENGGGGNNGLDQEGSEEDDLENEFEGDGAGEADAEEVVEGPNTVYDVMDGKQRLIAVLSFLDGKFPEGVGGGLGGREFVVSGLDDLDFFNGKGFKDLGKQQQKQIKDYVLDFTVVKHTTSPAAIFAIYEDINTGSDNHTPQMIRRAVFPGKYIKLLDRLARDPYLLKIRGAEAPSQKDEDREIILRFFAMHRSGHLYRPSMKTFLNKEISERKTLSAAEQRDMTKMFTFVAKYVFTVYGDEALRSSYKDKTGRLSGAKRLTMLWDAIMVEFAEYEGRGPLLESHKNALLDDVRKIFCENLFDDVKAPSKRNFKECRERFRARLKAILEGKPPGDVVASGNRRTFDASLKPKLLESQDGLCPLCSRGLDLEDAEIDHIVPYSRGGLTTLENAQLVHRWCNRRKGGA